MFVFFLQWTSQAFLQREQCVGCRFFVHMILLYWRRHAEEKKTVGFNLLVIKDLRQLLFMGVPLNPYPPALALVLALPLEMICEIFVI